EHDRDLDAVGCGQGIELDAIGVAGGPFFCDEEAGKVCHVGLYQKDGGRGGGFNITRWVAHEALRAPSVDSRAILSLMTGVEAVNMDGAWWCQVSGVTAVGHAHDLLCFISSTRSARSGASGSASAALESVLMT